MPWCRQQTRLRADFTPSIAAWAACRPVRALNEREKRAQVFFSQVNVCEFPQRKVLAAEPWAGAS